MNTFKPNPYEILEEVEGHIRMLELEESNLELSGKFDSDRDRKLTHVRAYLKAENQRREAVLEVINKLENK